MFRKEKLDRDLNDELASHLEMHTADNVRAGMPPDEARRQAILQLGGLDQTKESIRDRRGLPWLESVLQDFRFASRVLRKSPGFVVIAVTALALGIGFSTTIVSIFYNGVLHPFPYRDASQLSVIDFYDTTTGPRDSNSMFHLDEVATFRNQNHSFDDIVAYTGLDAVYSRKNSSEQLHGCVITPNAIDFWGVAPLLGRGLTEQDAAPGASPVVLLSYKFWSDAFNSDKNILGTQMVLNSTSYAVVGVMPRRFLLYGADVYFPISWTRPEPSIGESMENAPTYFFATGRLKHQVSTKSAAADIQVIAQQLVPLYRRDFPEHFQFDVRPLNEVIVGEFKQTLLLLIGAVVLLLLISSSNVASLLLTHHSSRASEIALRAALGASRLRLLRQLLVESLLIGVTGCLGGAFLAAIALRSVAGVPGIDVPGEADITMNMPILLFAVSLGLLTTLLFGLSPALFALRKDLRSSLQGSGLNVNASRSGARMRAGLVVGQVAISVLLLVFAGLMLRSFLAITHIDFGISTRGLLSAQVHFPPHQYETEIAKRSFFDQLLPRLSALPGVTNVAISISDPLSGSPGSEDVTIPGKPHDAKWPAYFEGVSERYFATLGVPLVRGTLISAADVASARRVTVVNQTLAKTFFGNEDPIGHLIKFNEFENIPQLPHDAYFQIIGVVKDFRNSGIEDRVFPQAYLPYTFTGFGDRALLLRSAQNPSRLVNAVRQILSEADSNVILVRPATMDEFLNRNVYVKPRFRVISFGACAVIGLALSLIGLFGVMAYSVALQTHELGIRMALGAQPSSILKLVLNKGLWLVSGGVILGLCAALLSVRLLQSQLWGVSAFDPRTFILATVSLFAVAILACYFPARRAIRIDPMIALRHE
jgi:putative ABC transport system permease protein